MRGRRRAVFTYIESRSEITFTPFRHAERSSDRARWKWVARKTAATGSRTFQISLDLLSNVPECASDFSERPREFIREMCPDVCVAERGVR